MQTNSKKAVTRKGATREDLVIEDIIDLLNPNGRDSENLTVPKTIVRIDDIHVAEPERFQGLASEALEAFCNGEQKGEIIFTRVPSDTDKCEKKDILLNLAFFEKLGFRQIQDLCGLEFSIPYIFLNDNPTTEIILMENLRNQFKL